MVGFNVLTVEQAYAAVDYNTLILLFGMMIVVANLRISGFFGVVSEWVVEHAHRPLLLLAAIVFVSGFFSAFFVNDTMCVVLTPLVLEICAALGRNAVPYLLAVAMGANVGSTATVTGNPQNMMIGSYSGITYQGFLARLAPVAVIGLVLTTAVIAAVYWKEFRAEARVDLPKRRVRVNRGLMAKSLVVAVAMIALFFAGWSVSKVAIVAGALLLLTRRIKPEKIYLQIDWPLLVMFAGLFVVIGGIERSVFGADLIHAARSTPLARTGVLSAVAATLSNLVSNVPAVLLFRPLIPHLPDPHRAWLALPMSSTLAGNLTLLGSVANLIVAERAKHQARIGFREYLKAGVPITVMTIAVGVWWLG